MKIIRKFKNHKGELYYMVLRKNPKLKKRALWGSCDPPDEDGAFIVIKEKLSDKDLFRTILHELVHGFYWDKSEVSINKLTSVFYTSLRKLGFKIHR